MSDEDRLKADWAEVLMTKGGRRIVIRLLAATNLLATCHVPGDTHGTAFLEGRRSVGLDLMNAINAALPGEFPRLLADWEKETATNAD
jgi:hypothetical protein